jgi:hypothetical protein
MLLAAVTLLGAAAPLAAQRAEARNFTLRFAPGSATQNGYADATLELSYWFQACPQVHLVIRYSPTAHMQVGAHRYWYDGRLVQVPPTIDPPRVSSPTVRGTVRGNGLVRDVTHTSASTTASCFYNGLQLGDASQFWKAGTSDEERVRILNQFGFDYQQTLGPLRNPAVENHFRQQFAAARRDSAQKAQVARADSLRRARERAAAERTAQASRDSAVRAQASEQGHSGSASTTGDSRSGDAASGTAPGGVGSRPAGDREAAGSRGTARDSAAARAAAEREQRERDAEHARVLEAQRREQAIQDSIRTEQLAQATAQAAVAVAQVLGMVFEGLEGTGLLLGASYGSPYFEGDRALVGITVSGYHDGLMLPFLEANWVIEGEEYGTERTSLGITVGSVVPKTGFSLPASIPLLGGQYKAHAGLVMLQTTEAHREFNYIERNRNFLMLGLTHFGGASKIVSRLDMTIYGGSPRWGVALGKAF